MSGIVARLRAAGCVFAEAEARLLRAQAASPEELAELVERRVSGLPLEHVLGWAEFRGLRMAVEPGVFVPRRRTEFLVDEAVSLLAAAEGPRPVVVDLCCGCGAIGAALAALSGPVELHVVDVDPVAVRCAERNVRAAGGAVYQGDLFRPLPAELRGRVAVLVANVPYVPTSALATLPPEARDHEPRTALDGGEDGLDVARRVAVEAGDWLMPGGHLLIESSAEQAPRAAAMFAAHGLRPRVVAEDSATVVVGTAVSGTPASAAPGTAVSGTAVSGTAAAG